MNVEQLKIVPYSALDQKAVWDLHLHTVKNNEGFLENLDFYEDVRNVPAHYDGFLLLKDNHNLIGMIGLKPLNEDCFEIKRLQVHKEYQGKGLGKLLVEKIVELAKTKNANSLILDFDKRHEYLNKFYSAFGFKKFDEGTVYMGANKEKFDLIYMKKDL